jgi:hypothetical protein
MSFADFVTTKRAMEAELLHLNVIIEGLMENRMSLANLDLIIEKHKTNNFGFELIMSLISGLSAADTPISSLISQLQSRYTNVFNDNVLSTNESLYEFYSSVLHMLLRSHYHFQFALVLQGELKNGEFTQLP